ncbi:MAG: hypothetical protein JNL50_11125 [Phycisphaerae bacterium]|nr:hypothetical protein [Phycisphaerae bacterium]
MRDRIRYQRDLASWLGLSSISLSLFVLWSDSQRGPRVSLESWVAAAIVALVCGMAYWVTLLRQRMVWFRHLVLTLVWIIVHAVIAWVYIF